MATKNELLSSLVERLGKRHFVSSGSDKYVWWLIPTKYEFRIRLDEEKSDTDNVVYYIEVYSNVGFGADDHLATIYSIADEDIVNFANRVTALYDSLLEDHSYYGKNE